jgi:hypothetical protein
MSNYVGETLGREHEKRLTYTQAFDKYGALLRRRIPVAVVIRYAVYVKDLMKKSKVP